MCDSWSQQEQHRARNAHRRATTRCFGAARRRTWPGLDADDAARRCRSSLHVLWLDLDVKLVACARAHFVRLPGGQVRVRLPHSLLRVGVVRAARRRECGVHAAHTRAPSSPTFATERAEVKKRVFIFDERHREKLRHCTARAPGPRGTLWMVRMGRVGPIKLT